MSNRLCAVFAVAIVTLFAVDSQARNPTPDEVTKIVDALKAQGCDDAIDIEVKGTNFEVDVACRDGKTYTFTLDASYKILGKKADKN